MKVLFLTPQVPYPPRKGTATRNFNLLRHVAGKHEVHLLTFAYPDGGEVPLPLKELCAGVHLVPAHLRTTGTRLRDLLTTGTPDLALRLASPVMTLALAKLLREVSFDVVQIEALEMSIHWERVKALDGFRARPPFVVFDDHNSEFLLQKRAFEIDVRDPAKWPAAGYSLLQWQRLLRYEAHFAGIADGVMVVCGQDEEAISNIANPRLMAVIENGIDSKSFATSQERMHTSGGPHLVFTGTMDYRPNVDAVTWFCREVFGRVRNEVPDVKLWIVGSNPKEEVKRLSKLDGVIVTGFVDDIRQFLERGSVYVVPMRFGGGVRFKVLEAMASGLPVVTTSMGCEGIRAIDGVHALVADSAGEFAAAVVTLLASSERRRTLGTNGLRLVAQNYDWEVILPKVDGFYEQLLGLTREAPVGLTGGNGGT